MTTSRKKALAWGVAILLGLTPLGFRIWQNRSSDSQIWRADAIRSGYDPDRYLEVRGYLEQHQRGAGLSDEQWSHVKEYMSNDKSATFRQLCTSLAREEANRGRPDAIDELRLRLADPDGYVVASTLIHLVKWLKVPDGSALVARFSSDKRVPLPEIIEAMKKNPPEADSLSRDLSSSMKGKTSD